MLNHPIDYFISDKYIALKADDNTELLISLKNYVKLVHALTVMVKRIFLAILAEKESKLIYESLILNKVVLVGSYAIRLFWKDGHSNGIYTFQHLKGLSE